MVLLAAPLLGQKSKMLAQNLSYPWTVNNQKSIKTLNIKYRLIMEPINDFFNQMYEHGAFKK
jgi:hypothetical protein